MPSGQDSPHIIQALMDQLSDSMEVNRNLMRALQDELNLNAKVRVSLEKDIEFLKKTVDRLNIEFLEGSPGNPPVIRSLEEIKRQLELAKLKSEELEKKIRDLVEEDKEERRQSKTNFWTVFAQTVPVLLSWLGLAIFYLIAQFVKSYMKS